MFDTQKKDDKEKTETISLLPSDQSCQRRDAGGERRWWWWWWGGGYTPHPSPQFLSDHLILFQPDNDIKGQQILYHWPPRFLDDAAFLQRNIVTFSSLKGYDITNCIFLKYS